MSDIRLVKTNNSIVINGALESNSVDTNNINVSGDIFVASNNAYMPVGCVSIYSGSNAPDGWLFCDGQPISRTTYANLFSIIGTMYGSGDGTTTFNLPNLQERLPLGKSSINNLGTIGGSNEITLSTSQLPSHAHNGTTNEGGLHTHTSNATGGDGGPGLAYANGSSTADGLDPTGVNELNLINTLALQINSGGNHVHTFTTDLTGEGEPINIQNKYIVMNYIIRY